MNKGQLIWILIIVAGIIFGILLGNPNYQKEPSWHARLCLKDYNVCQSVNFYGQDDFIAYCEARNGWYQISSTTTCIEWAEKEAKKDE